MATKALGATGLAELWSHVKAYVDKAAAGQASPPVGYYLVNSGRDPSADGYSGTWELVCVTDLGGGALWPGSSTYPSESTFTKPIGCIFHVWRRVA